MIAYKFLRVGLKSNHDGSPWEIGKWREVPAPTEECVGLNASKLIQDALGYVRGEILAKVEYGGKVIAGSDKLTCQKMRVLEVWDWNKNKSVKLAIYSAELVIGIYEKQYPGDNRPRQAIEAAKAYIKAPTGENAHAADASYAAAHASYAAAHAVYAAADASYAAAYAVYAAVYAVYAAVYAVYAAADVVYAAADAAYVVYAAADAAYAAAHAADAGIERKIHFYALRIAKEEPHV